MVKYSKPVKPNQSQLNKTRTLKQCSLGKSIGKVSCKRLKMQRRRIISLLSKLKPLEDKNKDLLTNLNVCNLEAANMKKEAFHWQRLYHESLIAVNTYKVKLADMVEALTACLGDIDVIYPSVVALTGSVANNKIRLCNMLNSLTSSGYDCLPRQFGNSGKVSDNSQQKNGTPMKHRVGPMVKGMLITKPKIMLERLMLPQPHDQEPVTSDMSPIEVTNQLTPIPEEREHEPDMTLRHISMRPKRKLGSSWRARRQEQLEKEQERERVKKSASAAYDGDTSDTESNPPAMNHMEPVVRFKDVSRLLQNSSLIKVDAARSVDGEVNTAIRQKKSPLRTAEDPLEGSSWMFSNNHNHHSSFRPSHNIERRTSLYNLESSDDDNEDEIAIRNNVSNLSHNNSISHKSQTFVLPSKNRNTSVPAENTFNSLDGSPTVEPDSTINVESPVLNNFTFKDSTDDLYRLSSSSSTSANRSLIRSSNTIIENNLINQSQCGQRMSIVANTVTVRLPKVPDASHFNSSCDTSKSKRASSFCDSCSPIQNSCAVIGKRVRKPKNQLYPGEDFLLNDRKKSKPAPGEKSKKKSKEKRTSKKKRPSKETDVDTNNESGTGGSSKMSVKSIKEIVGPVMAENLRNPKQSPMKKSVSTSIIPSIGGTNNSLGSTKNVLKCSKEVGRTVKTEQSKKSTMNKSVTTPRNSSTGGPKNSLNMGDAIKSRRNRGNVCYKESPMNSKLRRP